MNQTKIHTRTFEVAGKTISLETGRVAKQAGGSVLLGVDDTVILATATMSANAREGIDFLPLVCDYEEKKYAIGKIPGGFQKRGGKPSDRSILVSRLIDRPVRPLFPKGMRNDIQVIATPLAVDSNAVPDVLAICAAGAALTLSDIPFNGPIAGVRVARVKGEFIVFPTASQILEADIDIAVAGHVGAISMVEAGAKEASEHDMLQAIKIGHDAIKKICTEIKAFAEEAGKPKREVKLFNVDPKLIEEIEKHSADEIVQSISNPDKISRESAISDLTRELVAKHQPSYVNDPEKLAMLPEAVDKVIKGKIRSLIIEKDQRPDGRNLKQIRSLNAAAGILPKVHGCGLFTRGQTQVLTICTLGMPSDAQIVDDEESKRYMHFYNFPPYSVGEVRPLRGPGRREVGHGALAERALLPVVPLGDPNFPYTMLLTSEVLESNGSTSMASVCGSTLALMDAGVPIKAPVAGIAMGLMSDGKTFKVLTDIQGMEDFCGDMDFKVAGTKSGITALQLDTKLEGIPDHVLEEALGQAREARLQILDVITAELPAARSEISSRAPRLITIHINPDKIGALIGPGGSVIRKITTETGAQIDIEQDGKVLIGAQESSAAEAAIAAIKALTQEAKLGDTFTGPVTRLMGKGVMVEYIPGKEGLVPNEQLSARSISRPDDVVTAGDLIQVQIHEIDSMGRINLTALGLAQTLESLAGNEDATPPAPAKRERSESSYRDRGPRRDGGGGGYDRRGGSGGGDRGPRRDGGGGGYDRRGGSGGGDRGPRRDGGGGGYDRPGGSGGGDRGPRREGGGGYDRPGGSGGGYDRRGGSGGGDRGPRRDGGGGGYDRRGGSGGEDRGPRREGSGEDSGSRFRPRR